MDLDQFLGRKYKLATGDAKDYDEYLKFLGVGLVSRKTATSVNPVVELTKDENGYYVLTFTTLIKTFKIVFKIGEEFIEERPDGVKVKAKMTIEDGKLVHIQIENNGRTSKHVRTITMDSITESYYVLTFTTLVKTSKTVFKIGEDFVEERPDGAKVKGRMTIEDGKLVHIQIEDNGRTSKHVRTFTMDSITAVTTAEGWNGQCVRVYEYQP